MQISRRAALLGMIAAAVATKLPAPILRVVEPWLPAGYILPRGQLLRRKDYPALFAVIGTVYGGNDQEFRVPDYRASVNERLADSSMIPVIEIAWVLAVDEKAGNPVGSLIRVINQRNV